MQSKKAILVFTSFWDADYIIGNESVLFRHHSLVYQLNLDKVSPNFESQSIALSSPPLNKFKNLKSMDRIDVLCPTYNILGDYKADKDWDLYTKRYMELLNKRKAKTKEWIDSLEPNKIYLLCCWENTSGDSHCHRKLIYDAIMSSERAMAKVFPIYRDGQSAKEIPHKKVIELNDFDTEVVPF
jgi:hypothetical protein